MDYVYSWSSSVVGALAYTINKLTPKQVLEKHIIHEQNPLTGSMTFRLAGLSGALAVAAGAYGSHDGLWVADRYTNVIDENSVWLLP